MPEDQTPETNLEETGLDHSPSAQNIHAIVYQEAESELTRSSPALFWSGLAAGLSMGFSMIAEGLLKAYLPDAEWSILVSSFGYSIGFLIVILGKQQLFTENTLTPILPLLNRKDMATFLNVGRLWSVVLFANLLGTLLISLVIAYTSAFEPPVLKAFKEIGQKAMEPGLGTTMLRGVFAGWLIALMVWLIPYAETARIWVIIIITYIIGVGHFSHIIAGSVETMTLAALQQVSWLEVLGNYMLPTLTGNILGGVILVATINHAQIKAG
ncbi:formate/nitrite transporter family protein [Pontibacter oryzae]|uniref:Formate/nitrite transporter family protein n=1 Tax=Pontibacter oryzae TaxID=2304593 RepID=A0A399SGA0_9BACT|nr:formate/nitrite transporter family protein [Pontibacter oryzae]RIJ42044.1 formate/nitrite transporter family protein [Pontibacter oryzae]